MLNNPRLFCILYLVLNLLKKSSLDARRTSGMVASLSPPMDSECTEKMIDYLGETARRILEALKCNLFWMNSTYSFSTTF